MSTPPHQDQLAAPEQTALGGMSEDQACEADHANDQSVTKAAEIVQSTWTAQTFSIVLLVVLAMFYTLYLARSFFLPIILALLFSILLNPIVRAVSRVLPRALAAGLVMLLFVGGLGTAVWATAGPAQEWASALPKRLEQAERKARRWLEPMETMREAAEQVEHITEASTGGSSAKKPIAVAAEPGLADVMMSRTKSFFGTVVILLGLLYFLLAVGDLFLLKLVRVLPTLGDKKKAVMITQKIQADVSHHLLTITLINAGLGVAVALAMFALGVENPAFWGVLAGLLNFIPYLGAALGIGFLAVTSLVATDSWVQAMAPPAAYLLLTSLEGTFITPTVLGRRLALNPVAIFIGLLFWGWLWGVAGALLAVPILVILKIICDNITSLRAVGEMLGD